MSELIQSNVWQNVSVSVKQHGAMLRWNLSAPCRLEGEVRLCLQENSCREERAFRQQLESSMWTQNSKGLWVNVDDSAERYMKYIQTECLHVGAACGFTARLIVFSSGETRSV